MQPSVWAAANLSSGNCGASLLSCLIQIKGSMFESIDHKISGQKPALITSSDSYPPQAHVESSGKEGKEPYFIYQLYVLIPLISSWGCLPKPQHKPHHSGSGPGRHLVEGGTPSGNLVLNVSELFLFIILSSLGSVRPVLLIQKWGVCLLEGNGRWRGGQ